MPPKKIGLAEDFSGGSVNTPEFVDLPYMQPVHVVALRDFISKFLKLRRESLLLGKTNHRG